jgi:hypothetical protein
LGKKYVQWSSGEAVQDKKWGDIMSRMKKHTKPSKGMPEKMNHKVLKGIT